MKKEKIICVVHDIKSDTCDGYMIFNNTAEALRAFQMSCEKNEVMNKWPEDFEFFHLGKITGDGNKIEVEEEVYVLGKATDFIRPKGSAKESAKKSK